MLTKKTTLLLLKILEKIVSDKNLHARWLNTLSYLEYIGTRKMLKSLPANILDKTLLEHINEEARHSLFFKNLAERVSQTQLSFKDEELIAPQAGRDYFQKVDHFSLQFVKSSQPLLNYLYTTYAVEQRALAVYPLYDDFLSRQNFSFSLRAVLNDEKKHLQYVLESIHKMDSDADKNLEELWDFEHQKYFSFLISLEKEVFEPSFTKPLHNLNKNSSSLHPQKV